MPSQEPMALNSVMPNTARNMSGYETARQGIADAVMGTKQRRVSDRADGAATGSSLEATKAGSAIDGERSSIRKRKARGRQRQSNRDCWSAEAKDWWTYRAALPTRWRDRGTRSPRTACCARAIDQSIGTTNRGQHMGMSGTRTSCARKTE